MNKSTGTTTLCPTIVSRSELEIYYSLLVLSQNFGPEMLLLAFPVTSVNFPGPESIVQISEVRS